MSLLIERLKNPANQVTLVRLPLLVFACIVYVHVNVVLGVVIMAAAAATDFFDGRVARKYNCATEFGRRLDPIVDKIFMIGALGFALFVIDGHFQTMAIWTVFVTEAYMISITVLSVKWKHRVPKVVQAGKWGMFMRMTAIISLFLAPALSGVGHTAFVVIGCLAAVVGALLGLIASYSYFREMFKK